MFYLFLFFVFLLYLISVFSCFFFFFNDTATTEIYTLSLHDALPIRARASFACRPRCGRCSASAYADRKSTRLNSSHDQISYAVFCLKKKKPKQVVSEAKLEKEQQSRDCPKCHCR